jgi:RNA polymerase sigma factor (sigma-70 family)
MTRAAKYSLAVRLWDFAVLHARQSNHKHTGENPKIAGKKGAWRRWQREKCIISLMPMVERIARDVRPMFAAHIELDDLTQAGHLGLVRAAAVFDPAKASAVGFESFAYFRVRGAIIDSQKRRAYREEANVSLQALRSEDGWLPPALDRDPGPLPDHMVECEQIRGMLTAALDELPDVERRVLRAQLAGEPVRAVARAVGMSPTWTRAKLAEARAKVETRFWEEGAI